VLVDHSYRAATTVTHRGGLTAAVDRLAQWLGSFERLGVRHAVMVLAVTLCLPTLGTGLALDDYVLLSRMTQPATTDWAGSAPFDLFRWLDPAHNTTLIDGQGMPWWTFEGARCAFFRPLASLSHYLDYRLFGRDPLAMHVHSLLWFALLLWLASKAYAEFLGQPWVAGVSLAMFAFDSAHGVPVCWISNRNALMAGALGIAAIHCHHRARRDHSFGFACAAWLYFALALASGELAVGIVGYLLAYALFYDQAALVTRIRTLLPFGALLGIWTLLHIQGGYGSYGIGAYVDPIAEPRVFLREFPLRWSVLMASQIGGLVSDLYPLVPARFVPALAIAAALLTALGAFVVAPAMQRRSTRFFVLGSALSALPLAATIPADRLLVLTGFGAMPALALGLQSALRASHGLCDASSARIRAARRSIALTLTGMHLVVAPLVLPVAALSTALVAHWTEQAETSLPADANVPQQVLIVASIPDSVLLTYVPTMRAWTGKPNPRRLYWLNAMPGDAYFERRADNRLRVSANQGLFDRRSEARGLNFAFKPGDKVVLTEMTIEVLDLNAAGLPSVCDFVFASPLESLRYRWQTWQDGRLRDFEVPKLGASKRVKTTS
jgi:hypothetical protein